ncbi:MAG: leucyl aminopeptidase [Acidobacteria bacterium]|nr:leucyl aminopeptidase [Acidobacteriota bacterium]
MALKITTASSVPAGTDLIAVPLGARTAKPATYRSLGVSPAAVAAHGFTGRADHVAVVAGTGGRMLALIGTGDGPIDTARLRRVGAQAARTAGKVRRVAVDVRDIVAGLGAEGRPEAVRAIAEGLGLGSYRFTEFKSTPAKPTLRAATIVVAGGARSAAAAAEGAAIAAAQNLARDLVNRPGGTLTPRALAAEARRIATREELGIKVMGPAQIERLGLGGLLGVNRGSTEEPRFVQISHDPPGATRTLALVGKGITFDSGGLSIKTGEGMMTMKMDMGGAAAVLGFFSAVRTVAPRCRVIGYLPMTDNMSDGDATRPGDVLRIRNGTTVEVLNTDAEGRLILADALSLASEAKPDAIIDLATLTGAVEIALGSRIAAVLANDDAWRDQVVAAADRAGERVWPLPLPADYRPFLDSDVADLRNISKGRGGGTITAGLFLQEFVAEGIPWAHLDIAGTAWWAEGDNAEHSNGGTGYGVRLLLELARSFNPPRRGSRRARS